MLARTYFFGTFWPGELIALSSSGLSERATHQQRRVGRNCPLGINAHLGSRIHRDEPLGNGPFGRRQRKLDARRRLLESLRWMLGKRRQQVNGKTAHDESKGVLRGETWMANFRVC